MKRSIAELITRDPEKFAHHDRVFKNNPVVMQGMGLAPLVVLATTGKNALMLAVAVALLLTPSRMLACLVSRLFPLRDEQPAPEELEKKLLPRALVYSGSAAVVYLAAYPILNAVFGTDLLMLGIYLPMLVVEPLLTYRFGRVQESMHKAVSKGLRITVGYALILFIVGCLREWLALGSVFGIQLSRSVLPMASMPAGGFIVLGVVCAVWRALARKHKEYLKTEARGTLAAHPPEGGAGSVSAVMNTIGVAFAYAVLALFAQNAIFTRGLGVSRLIQLVGDERTSSWWFALLLCVTQTLVAPLAYFAGSQIVDLPYRAQLRPLLYLACVAVVCIFEHAILRAVKGPRSGLLIRILPIAAVNSGVLGTVLVERTQSFTLAQSIGFGLGSGLGYLLAVMLVTEAGNRLRSKAIPEAFRGLPITLIYIGVLALAIYGFTGHSVIL